VPPLRGVGGAIGGGMTCPNRTMPSYALLEFVMQIAIAVFESRVLRARTVRKERFSGPYALYVNNIAVTGERYDTDAVNSSAAVPQAFPQSKQLGSTPQMGRTLARRRLDSDTRWPAGGRDRRTPVAAPGTR